MTFEHRARRGLATAAGGLVVVGAGATAGVVVADMHAAWSDQAALEAAAALAAQPSDAAPVRPVVVTLTEEHHVTPEPVVVRRKVYRTRWVSGSGGTALAPMPAGPTRAATSSPAAPRSTSPARPRTVVAPAPAAPAPASGSAAPATTSKTS